MKSKNEISTKIDRFNEIIVAPLDKASRKTLLRDVYKPTSPAIYLISFDTRDKEDYFRKFEHDIDATILSANDGDQVYLSIYSPGGSAIAYANAAQQIERLCKAGLRVTAFVNEVAASGGYMMACVCDKVVAGPMAIVGSIGVVAQVPNFVDGLGKLGVRFDIFTAGEVKRTVTPFTIADDNQKKHFEGKLVEMHDAFRKHVTDNRPQVDDAHMNGDHFLASDTVGVLVDELGDLQSALMAAVKRRVPIYRVQSGIRKGFSLKGLVGMDSLVDLAIDRLIARIMEMRFTGIQ